MRWRGGLLLAVITALLAVPPMALGATDAIPNFDATGVIVAGLVALGAIAVALLAASTRRRPRRDARAEAALTAEATVELLRQRTLRRARVHVENDEDPIVAALGVGEPHRQRTRRRG
jgi:hypothetical protein